jgi:hypothetical protein
MTLLTKEQIAKVFSDHYHCEVYVTTNLEGRAVIEPVTSCLLEDIENDWWLGSQGRQLLLLTPLTHISNEDALQLARILIDQKTVEVHRSKCWGYDSFELISLGQKYRFYFSQKGELEVETENTDGWKPCQGDLITAHFAYEFLRWKKYAVPLLFGPNHPSNGKTAIALRLAIDATVPLEVKQSSTRTD